jgi:hypothetical protein
MIGPKECPLHRAAHAAIAHDNDRAARAVFVMILDDASTRDYDWHDCDEDGPYSTIAGEIRNAVEQLIELTADAVGDTAYLLLEPLIGEDFAVSTSVVIGKHLIEELTTHLEFLCDETREQVGDAEAYRRSPSAYHGVSNADF